MPLSKPVRLMSDSEKQIKMDGGDLTNQVFSIPLDDARLLVYAPLKGMAFIANPALINAILDNFQQPPATAENENACLQVLRQKGFFEPEPYPSDEYTDRGVCYDAAILFLTNCCNLRCTYCYASSGDHAPVLMTWEIAKAAIEQVVDAVVKRNSHEFTLGFHGGGEPTLNWEILTRAAEYARRLCGQNGLELQLCGSFNGYWTEPVRQYIIANFTDISISFDGLPQVQNSQRPAVGQKESFDRVSETLSELDRAQRPYGLRMTVTNDSIALLPESVAFICKNFQPRRIQVEPVFLQGRAREFSHQKTDPGFFISQFIAAYRLAAAQGIELFYSGARPDLLTQRFCLAACRALIVTTEGEITVCFEAFGREHPLSNGFIVGSYQGNGAFSVDPKKLDRHFCRQVQEIAHCNDCFCRWHCAGDCAIKTSPEGQFQSTDRCHVNRELTKFLILERLRASGGLLWERGKISPCLCGIKKAYE